MITFESEYKNFNQRFFRLNNLFFFIEFILLSPIIIIFNLSLFFTIIIEIFLVAICIYTIVNQNKSNIHIIALEENNIILHGETFNTKWEKSLNINEINIEIKSNSSRQGLRGVTFYLKLKNKKDNYIINSFQTFSDQQIIKIFNEFKNKKKERIIVDERIILLQIQEKIDKYQ